MASGKYLNKLLDVYCIGGDVSELANRIYEQAGTQHLEERADWLTRDSDCPTRKEIFMLFSLLGNDAPKPILMATLAVLFRLRSEVESLRKVVDALERKLDQSGAEQWES